MRIKIVVSLVAGLILAASGPALATAVFVGDDMGWIDEVHRSAMAVFEQTATGMTVTLTNLSTLPNVGDASLGGTAVLTGVFFNIAGSSPSLTANYALAAPGSIVNPQNSSEWDKAGVQAQIAAGNVTGEWAYGGDVNHKFSQPVLNEGPVIVKYGISSAGLNEFGPKDLFIGNAQHPSVNLDTPLSPDGANYGIVSTDVVLNPGIGVLPLIQDSVTFTLTGFNDVSMIQDVWFQYGTGWNEPDFTVYVGGQGPENPIPEPVTMAGVFLGLCGLAGYVRKRR